MERKATHWRATPDAPDPPEPSSATLRATCRPRLRSDHQGARPMKRTLPLSRRAAGVALAALVAAAALPGATVRARKTAVQTRSASDRRRPATSSSSSTATSACWRRVRRRKASTSNSSPSTAARRRASRSARASSTSCTPATTRRCASPPAAPTWSPSACRAGYPLNETVVLVRADSDIRRLDDLKGKQGRLPLGHRPTLDLRQGAGDRRPDHERRRSPSTSASRPPVRRWTAATSTPSSRAAPPCRS